MSQGTKKGLFFWFEMAKIVFWLKCMSLSNFFNRFGKKKYLILSGQKVKFSNNLGKVGKATYHTRTGIYAGFFS